MFKKLFNSDKKSEQKDSQQTVPTANNNKKADQKPTSPTKEIKKPEWKLEDFVVAEEEGKTRFHDLELHPQVMHAIADLGFPYCTPIQAQTLPFALKGLDVIGQAQTGTGKSAAFLTVPLSNY